MQREIGINQQHDFIFNKCILQNQVKTLPVSASFQKKTSKKHTVNANTQHQRQGDLSKFRPCSPKFSRFAVRIPMNDTVLYSRPILCHFIIGTTDARVACSSVFTRPFSN